jgi:hypothetical protein
MTDRGREFADLVYTVVIAEKRFPLKRLALDMGLGYDALHARIGNRTPFSADEIRRLIRAAPDPRFAVWLLRGTRFVAAERIGTADGCDSEFEAIHLAATRIVLEAADVLEVVEAALTDDRLDHREALRIRAEIEVAEQALATLAAGLRRLHPEPAADA